MQKILELKSFSGVADVVSLVDPIPVFFFLLTMASLVSQLVG